MPGIDGMELIRKVKEKLPDTEIIIISGYRHFEYAQTAIRYGAVSYTHLTLVSVLPSNNEEDLSEVDCTDDLNRMCAGIEGYTGDTAAALQMISDNNFFMEVKKNYGTSMVTGFIRLNGSTVGCVANRSEVYENGEKVQTLEAALCGKGCEKATDFINFCDCLLYTS